MDAADLSATVRDFLSAFVTEVLAVRGLYSPDLFDRRRVLGFVAARRARHPGLAAYIDSAVGGMVDPLIRGDISKVAVLILDANGALLERFVADLKVQAEILASVEPEDVEAALRSALLKLQRAGDGAFGGGIGVEGEEENENSRAAGVGGGGVRGGGGGAAGGALRPLPKGCTFEVVAHARSRDALPRDAWVDADPVAAAAAAAAAARRRGSPVSKDAAAASDDGGGGGGDGGDGDDGEERTSSLLLPPRGVLPLKSARAGGGALRLQVYVEGVA